MQMQTRDVFGLRSDVNTKIKLGNTCKNMTDTDNEMMMNDENTKTKTKPKITDCYTIKGSLFLCN